MPRMRRMDCCYEQAEGRAQMIPGRRSLAFESRARCALQSPMCNSQLSFAIAVCIVIHNAASIGAKEPKAEPIFDGKTLKGWSGDTRYWRVEDEAITGEIRAG